MTAARPSEALSLGFERHGWPARVLAGLLCVTTAWVPWALAWGDAVSDAGRAAQGEGRALANGVTLPQVNGNSLTLFPGQANQTQLDFDAVFPGSAGGNRADYTNLFGNDLGVINAGRAAQTDLLLDDSATGAAYQTLRGSVDRSRPDMLNDPLWSQTDDVLDNFEDLAASFADCSIDTRFTEDERRTHVPDIHTCERVADYSGACDIRHAYTIEQILENGSGGSFAACGDGCILWTVGQAFPTGPCYQELTGHDADPEARGDPQRPGRGPLVRGLYRRALDRRQQSLLPHGRRVRERRLALGLARARRERLLQDGGGEARPAGPDPGRQTSAAARCVSASASTPPRPWWPTPGRTTPPAWIWCGPSATGPARGPSSVRPCRH